MDDDEGGAMRDAAPPPRAPPPSEPPPKATAAAPLAPLPTLMLLLAAVLLAAAAAPAARAENSKFYYMHSLCKNHFLQQLYRKIDGAVLWSQNERNLDCVITFQTHSILQRFMLRFDMLQLDCNDHLFIYDGAHAVGAHKADLSCRNTMQSVGAIFTRTNFVTLKYVTDNWGTDTNGFKLVITAVKDPKHGCKDFQCAMRDFCISGDLVCDGVNHCADGSDESPSSLCQNPDTNLIMGLELPWLMVGGVSAFLVICAIASMLALCLCRRSPRQQNADDSQMQLQQMYGSNGSAGKLQQHQLTTMMMSNNQQTELPVNWRRPAGRGGEQGGRPCNRQPPAAG